MRTLFVLICSFALTCAARVDHANKNESGTKPSQHAAARSKRTPASSAHASPATDSKHLAGGSTQVKHMQTLQHVPKGRHKGGWGRAARQKPEVTPMPTPEVTPMPTPEVTPMPTPEVTPTPTPTGDSYNSTSQYKSLEDSNLQQ